MTLTRDEAAELVGVSPWTISKWVQRGYLTPIRPGAKPSLFREDDVTECAFQRIPRSEHDALDALWDEILARGEQVS